MSLLSIPAWLKASKLGWFFHHFGHLDEKHPTLSALARMHPKHLPTFVQNSEVAMNYLRLFGVLDWDRFPERPDKRFSPTIQSIPFAPFVAAYLVKIDRNLIYIADLHQYLIENPPLIWILGFPVITSSAYPWGFDARKSLPTYRHFSRILRTMPNMALQFLLDNTVHTIQAELVTELPHDGCFGDCISLDTKHIIAWVKENNPKTFIRDGRFDKNKQPPGDADCRLGCKRKHNQHHKQESVENMPASSQSTISTTNLSTGEYYWGYGSGVVATKIPDWGEFVLAELTQPFDQADVSYFSPLMTQVERRLGFKPRFGALDAAFDAFYVYDYFASSGGFAAVPFVERGQRGKRQFDQDGAPFCKAGLPMTFLYSFLCKTTLIQHERSRYGCPLLHPTPDGNECPIHHKNWTKKGCISTIASSSGARLRYQIDRESEEYKMIFRQRTATERVNSQAVALGIERPKLRNISSVANQNTLIYVLINLHAIQRIRLRKSDRPRTASV